MKARRPRPIFKHDSDCCKYMGTVIIDNKSADLYHCGQTDGNWPTLISRFSNEGSDYASGLEFGKYTFRVVASGEEVKASKHAAVAYLLAKLNGYNTRD